MFKITLTLAQLLMLGASVQGENTPTSVGSLLSQVYNVGDAADMMTSTMPVTLSGNLEDYQYTDKQISDIWNKYSSHLKVRSNSGLENSGNADYSDYQLFRASFLNAIDASFRFSINYGDGAAYSFYEDVAPIEGTSFVQSYQANELANDIDVARSKAKNRAERDDADSDLIALSWILKSEGLDMESGVIRDTRPRDRDQQLKRESDPIIDHIEEPPPQSVGDETPFVKEWIY